MPSTLTLACCRPPHLACHRRPDRVRARAPARDLRVVALLVQAVRPRLSRDPLGEALTLSPSSAACWADRHTHRSRRWRRRGRRLDRRQNGEHSCTIFSQIACIHSQPSRTPCRRQPCALPRACAAHLRSPRRLEHIRRAALRKADRSLRHRLSGQPRRATLVGTDIAAKAPPTATRAHDDPHVAVNPSLYRNLPSNREGPHPVDAGRRRRSCWCAPRPAKSLNEFIRSQERIPASSTSAPAAQARRRTSRARCSR